MSVLSQTCSEAARLISDSQEQPLPWMARVGLRMHLAICRHCRRYQHQVQLMHTVFQEFPDRLTNVRLPENFRTRLVGRLKDESSTP